jgi:hypothetical protein
MVILGEAQLCVQLLLQYRCFRSGPRWRRNWDTAVLVDGSTSLVSQRSSLRTLEHNTPCSVSWKVTIARGKCVRNAHLDTDVG